MLETIPLKHEEDDDDDRESHECIFSWNELSERVSFSKLELIEEKTDAPSRPRSLSFINNFSLCMQSINLW
jgi:hypothetical protein